MHDHPLISAILEAASAQGTPSDSAVATAAHLLLPADFERLGERPDDRRVAERLLLRVDGTAARLEWLSGARGAGLLALVAATPQQRRRRLAVARAWRLSDGQEAVGELLSDYLHHRNADTTANVLAALPWRRGPGSYEAGTPVFADGDQILAIAREAQPTGGIALRPTVWGGEWRLHGRRLPVPTRLAVALERRWRAAL